MAVPLTRGVDLETDVPEEYGPWLDKGVHHLRNFIFVEFDFLRGVSVLIYAFI